MVTVTVVVVVGGNLRLENTGTGVTEQSRKNPLLFQPFSYAAWPSPPPWGAPIFNQFLKTRSHFRHFRLTPSFFPRTMPLPLVSPYQSHVTALLVLSRLSHLLHQSFTENSAALVASFSDFENDQKVNVWNIVRCMFLKLWIRTVRTNLEHSLRLP